MAAVTPDPGEGAHWTPVAATGVHRLGIDGLPVPRLRGRIHQATVVPFALAGVAVAALVGSLVERVAVGVFTLGVVAMLTASAAYHCHSHTFERKLLTRRLDHAMIFVAIAGSQTAYWLLVAPPVPAVAATVTVWLIAAGGIHYKLNRLTLQGSTGSWLYAALGWTGVALVPYLVATSDVATFATVLAGGLVYTGGGVILARRAVDPWPRVFGYHEVWHLLVVFGAAIHFAGIVRLVVTAA